MDRFSLTFRWSLLCAALYWGYALAVVPWIEPQIDLDASRAVVPSSVEGSVPRLRKRLRTWFAEEAWEVNEASKILETSQGIIILRNYQNLPDGTVRLWPCSFVLFPNRPDADEQAMRDQAVVLQASQGAVLRFDSPIDLRTAKLGKLLGGKLVGPVAVRSGGRSPGPEDDLYIAAADVDLSNDLLGSPNEVTFRWGRNQGRGTGLEVRLLVREGDARGQPAFEGVRSLQLQERVWMELYMGDKLFRDAAGPTVPPPATPGRSAAAIPLSTEQPIHAQSKGMFRFDLVERQVRFENDVLLSRPTTLGGAEQLACDDLLLLFDSVESPPTSGKASAEAEAVASAEGEAVKQPSSDVKKMTLRELQAVGRPVKLGSPSRQLEVECELLQWNERTGWLSLGRPQRKEGAPALTDLPVRAKQGTNEITAPEMHLQFDRANRQLNRATAAGPGEMWSRASAKPLHVSWRDRLEAVPEGKLQVVHIHGDATVESETSGKLSAELIRLWLFDGAKPPEAVARLPVPRRSQGSWQPHHLEAGPNVSLQSNLMTGKLNQLELWFEHPAPGSTGAESVPASPAGRGGAIDAVGAPLSRLPDGPPRNPATDPGEEELVPASPSEARPGDTAEGPRATSASLTRPGAGAGGPPPKTPPRRFTVTGDRFWGRVAFIDQKPTLVEGRGEGGIDLLEEAPQSPGASTGLTGDSVQFLQDAQSGEVVSLVGKPARVRADGLVLEGEAIHFGRTKNEVWVNGPGLLQLKLRSLDDPAGAAPANPAAQAVRSPLEVRWRGGMHFDGLAARFEGDVKAAWEGKTLRAERIDALLTEKMSFSESPQDAGRRKPTLSKLQCPQDFFLESRTFGQGRMVSLERMQARDLTVEIETGFTVAQGPGWVMQIRSGGFSLDSTAAGAKPNPTPGRRGLQFLQSTFQEELSGNFKQRHLRFHGQVETVYGPVDDWDESVDPDRLGPEAFWMRCDLLGVRQTPEAEGAKPTYELDALDDVQLEGREFSGAAARLSYNQAKDLLVLEGDGRADARLVRQPQPGGNASRYAARKILYWRSFDRVKIEDARQAEVDGGIPSSKGR